MARIMMIEDDEIMAECIARAINSNVLHDSDNNVIYEHEISHFSNAIAAMDELNEELPDLIILDIMLGGPDGFSFLNELISYEDTAKIPVIIITSLNLGKIDLRHYGVQKVLQKEAMTPEMINDAVKVVLSHVQ